MAAAFYQEFEKLYSVYAFRFVEEMDKNGEIAYRNWSTSGNRISRLT